MVQSIIKKYYVMFFGIIVFLTLSSIGLAAEYFDWDKRVDRDGKPAGHYEITPFPIDENSTSYSITNDEGMKTYQLGTKYYVDGKNGNDYNNGLSLASAKKTIKAAISAAGNGNKTIIVRGTHDGWNGIYYESGIRSGYGVDETHRWMLVGYGQERPIIDGGNGTTDIIKTTGQVNAYATVQRVKIQNSKRQGVYLGLNSAKRDKYFNLIDVWVYNCTNDADYASDGNIYFYDIDYGWIYHITSEHTYGYGIKYADGGDNGMIEWSVVRETGYWEGIPETAYWGKHAYGIHFSATPPDKNENGIIRYNVIYDNLFHGLQIRNAPNFSVHHNEIYHCTRCWSFMSDTYASCDSHSAGPFQAYIYLDETDGDFYSNVVREAGSNSSSRITHLTIRGCDLNNPEINVFNNLFYESGRRAIYVAKDNTGARIKIYCNTLYTNSSGTLIDNDMGSATKIINNIFYQAGTGSVAEIGTADHTYNLYYYPNGKRGTTLGIGEKDGDPQFDAIPSGPYSAGKGNITTNSPAKDTGIMLAPGPGFDKIFNKTDIFRPQGDDWDIGAYEFIDGYKSANVFLFSPTNLRTIN